MIQGWPPKTLTACLRDMEAILANMHAVPLNPLPQFHIREGHHESRNNLVMPYGWAIYHQLRASTI